jgi:phosphate transport system substrate-binding protein
LKLVLLCILVFSVIAVPGCRRQTASVVVAGSTSVQSYAEVLMEEYKAVYPDRIVNVQGGGSSAGAEAVRSGTAHFGMLSRGLRADEVELWNTVIAKDGLAVIVHRGNHVNGLSLEQIRKIYTGEIMYWSDVGGNNTRIHIIAREEGSGTRGAFEELVMDELRITPKAIIQNSNGAVRQLVAGDSNSIGFISLGLVDSRVKAIEIDGIAPTRENVINGGYGLYRSFLFVSNGEPEGSAKQFLDYIMSPDGRRILETEGLVTE